MDAAPRGELHRAEASRTLKVCAVTNVRSIRNAVSFAVAAEQKGFWGVAVIDTAPRLFQAVYPAVTACLMSTNTVRVATHVTNVVSQHWSVHASTARALEELAPGRFILGLATGDGAVRSVGLVPASWPSVQSDVLALREEAPANLEIQIAASGPRGAAVAGAVGTELITGTGLDIPALRYLGDIADDAADRSGRNRPGKWMTVVLCLVDREGDAEAARSYVRGVAVSIAHFALGQHFEGKNVPERWRRVLRERLSNYDYRHHGAEGATSNATMFEDLPELERYLVDRMVVVGTIEQCRERLLTVVREAGIDGLHVATFGPLGPPHAIELLDRVAAVVLPT